eukprot:TRINITY_DN1713_c0_g1_i7.p1 TRINITY_DN1713_c0_g1~~TRINITY_DN1713_c0_g1_i7.p1  ORF type:complete len:166 (-),score=27.54 TRINITY_DN1713_c0_g1_i7:67-564(-)
MAMKRASVLAMCILVAIGDAAFPKAFNDCVMKEVGPVQAVCKGCSPECESALEALSTKLDGHCCVYFSDLNERALCEERMPRAGAHILKAYHAHCPVFDDFAAALMDVMPFRYYGNKKAVVAVETEKSLNLGVVAIGAAIAGAVGASVAMVVASWNVRKQALLAN